MPINEHAFTNQHLTDWQNYVINLIANQHQLAKNIFTVVNAGFIKTKQRPDISWMVTASQQNDTAAYLYEDVEQMVGGITYTWKLILPQAQMIDWVNYLTKNPLNQVLYQMIQSFVADVNQWTPFTYADYYQYLNQPTKNNNQFFNTIFKLELKLIALIKQSH